MCTTHAVILSTTPYKLIRYIEEEKQHPNVQSLSNPPPACSFFYFATITSYHNSSISSASSPTKKSIITSSNVYNNSQNHHYSLKSPLRPSSYSISSSSSSSSTSLNPSSPRRVLSRLCIPWRVRRRRRRRRRKQRERQPITPILPVTGDTVNSNTTAATTALTTPCTTTTTGLPISMTQHHHGKRSCSDSPSSSSTSPMLSPRVTQDDDEDDGDNEQEGCFATFGESDDDDDDDDEFGDLFNGTDISTQCQPNNNHHARESNNINFGLDAFRDDAADEMDSLFEDDDIDGIDNNVNNDGDDDEEDDDITWHATTSSTMRHLDVYNSNGFSASNNLNDVDDDPFITAAALMPLDPPTPRDMSMFRVSSSLEAEWRADARDHNDRVGNCVSEISSSQLLSSSTSPSPLSPPTLDIRSLVPLFLSHRHQQQHI